jgi:hypothetical protein
MIGIVYENAGYTYEWRVAFLGFLFARIAFSVPPDHLGLHEDQT